MLRLKSILEPILSPGFSGYNSCMSWKKGFLVVLMVLCLTFGIYEGASASVIITMFEAFAETTDIYLTWQTSSETNNQGFYVTRSTTQSGTYTRISTLIPATSSVAGADYEYVDAAIQVNVDYYYKLEAVDTSNVSTFYGPIHQIVLLEGAATSTATATSQFTPTRTRTSTPTPTQSLFSPTPTATATATPQNFTPPAASATSQFSPTISAAGEITMTATLAPVPPIDLLFPVNTPASINSIVSVPTPTLVITFTPAQVVVEPVFSLKTAILGAIVLFLWLFLAGFLVLFFRKIIP